jgi:HAE1 family hydrophobic/amphiphilic exporter-1
MPTDTTQLTGRSMTFSIPGLFIRRPVMTTLVMVGVLIFGIIAYTKLPVSDLPNVDYPTIHVFASLPGASPETMAAAVATPLEKQFSTIAGIDNMTSSSDLGTTDLVIQFNVDRKIDAAAQDVQAAISQAMVYLPSNILPPTFHRSNPAAAPVMFMALTSKVEPLSVLDEIAETTIAQRISMVDGVAEVGVWGSQKFAVRIALNPQALSSRGIGVDQVTGAVNAQNVNLPTGIMWGPNQAVTVQATGNLYNAAQFGAIVIAYHNGAPVLLRDVASVTNDVQNIRTAAWVNDQRSVSLGVLRQPGTNTVAVTRAVTAVLDEIRAEIPPDVTLRVNYDRSTSIAKGVHDVKFSFGVALVLVVLVIFAFLRNLSATIIPSLALPMSVIGTFSVMYLLNYSIDNLSLLALTLCVGFVVDDAIVVLENIVRHMEMGKPRRQAALDGAAEVGSTIVTMTTSLSAVFIPIMFMGGLIGMLFHEFGVTIAVAILVSGCVSLTLTPMLCSRFLSPIKDASHGRLYAWSESVFNFALHGYERSLVWIMRHRPIMLGLSALTLVVMVTLFVTIPKGLFPSDDTGWLQATTEGAEGISFEAILPLQQRIDSILLKDPNIQTIMPSVGSQGSANQGRIFMTLKPLGNGPHDRHISADSLVSELMPKLNVVPGIAVYVQNPPSLRVGGRGSKSFYQYTLQGPDLHEVEALATQLETRLRARHEFEGVTTDLQIKNPQLTVQINRDRATQLGITAAMIEHDLYDAYGSRQVSTIYTPTNEYWVVMEAMPQYERDENSLAYLYIRAPATGKLVPLASIAHLERTVGPLEINHQGQIPSVTISFNVVQDVALSQAVSLVEKISHEIIPEHITAGFAGQAQAFQDSLKGMVVLLALSVFVIYVVLGILYESFIHPITILSGIPFAAVGALLALLATHHSLDVYGYVGMIMLIGIVKKNAIMMIDFAIATERSTHKSASDSIVEAASIRFRPIMMTTAAAVMGSLPIALGLGATGASRQGLGIVVVGGLAISQIVTLYMTPVFYTYLDELQAWLGRGVARASNPVPIALPAPAGD